MPVEPAYVSVIRARTALGWPRAPFTVVHTGNIGLKQDLGNVVEAARGSGAAGNRESGRQGDRETR